MNLLAYNPLTGLLTWTQNRRRIRAGEVAGNVTPRGYVKIKAAQQMFYAHRLAWELSYGPIPTGMEVDHINGDKGDNRLANLRLVTSTQNKYNRGKQRNNSTGYKGVSKWPNKPGFRADITAEGIRTYLGTFPSAEQASKAYMHAEAHLHKEHRPLE